MRASSKETFLKHVKQEATRAAKAWPYPNPNLAALMEEVGELAQAMLQQKPYAERYSEAVQVAVMAMRCALEGDPQFDEVSK